MASLGSRLRALFENHRRRLATGALLIFLGVVGIEIADVYPRSVDVALPLGQGHGDIAEAHIEYSYEGEAVRSVIRRFGAGAPAEVRDTVELSPGVYDVSVLLVDRGGALRRLAGHVTAPADGLVRVALEGS